MKTDIEKRKEPLACLRCGKCCFVDLTAYARESDFERWRSEHRQDILHIIENRHLLWAGDRLISTRTGMSPQTCPFLEREGGHWRCSIYETRPLVCREYQPGTSELCPQYHRGRRYKKEPEDSPVS
ncbi:MAG: YkgJ family cysteine cluster protein [Syntrophales bacterium]|jgi:Fe-S-cluster containining protein|nr:YkgJ family cysteine cluster protein [Syntrophales bacterium]MDY0043701.1 YkgJ family cysteine cluster protein [Syntrophales bacterium]